MLQLEVMRFKVTGYPKIAFEFADFVFLLHYVSIWYLLLKIDCLQMFPVYLIGSAWNMCLFRADSVLLGVREK